MPTIGGLVSTVAAALGDLVPIERTATATSDQIAYRVPISELIGLGPGGNLIAAGTETALAQQTIVFSNSNGVSFGLNGTVLTASAAGGGVALSAGTQSVSTGTVVFSNSNGVSFGLSGSQLTASIDAIPSVTGLVPYTGASTRLDLGSQWLSQVQGIVFSTGDLARTVQEGVLVYDLKNKCMSLDMFGGTRLQVGQELYIIVYNDSGSLIANGTAVYQNGAARVEYATGKFGDYPTIRLALADSNDTCDVIGIATMDIPDGGFGFVTSFGVVNDLDTSGFASGEELWLSPTVPGELTNVRPDTPAKAVIVGIVIRSHATAGNIRLNIELTPVISDLDDVVIASPSDGDVLRYDGGQSAWVNGGPGAAVINVSAGTTSVAASAFVFSNSNGVSFGLNGSTVTGSHNGLTTAALSNHSHGDPQLNLTNLSGTTASNSAGLTISLSAAAPATVVALAGGTQTATSGTVVFSNSNGISFGMSGSSRMTASYTVPSTAGLISAINISGGTTSNNLSAVTFADGNGVSFGLNGSVITASIPAIAGAQTGISGLANSETTYTSGSVTFSALGAITIRSTTGQQFQFSVNSQTAQTENVVVPSAGTQTATSGTVVFSNSNGISFGMSGSSRITASYTVPSTAGLISAVNLSAGTTSQDLAAFVLSNSNNVSFGLNGSTVTASASQSVQTQSNVQGISAGTQVGRTGDIVFSNSNGISFGMAGSTRVTASYTVPSVAGLLSAINVSAGTTSNDLSALTFSNSNGISFGLNASIITASYTVPTVPAQLSVGMSTAGNTSGDTGFVTGRLALVGGANITLSGSTNAGSMTLSISAASAAAAPVNFSAGTTSGNLGSVVFSNSNGISFGLNGSTITASAAGGGVNIAASDTTFTSGTVVMSNNGGALTIGSAAQSVLFSVPQTSSLVGASGISISTNGSTVSVYQPAISYYANADYPINTTSQTVGQSTSVVFPFRIKENLSADFMRMAHTVSIASTSFASTANSAYTYQQAETHNLVLYSLGTGASSLSMRSIFSTSAGFTFSIRCSQNTTNNISVSHGMSYPVSNGTSSQSFSFAATNSTMQVSTTHLTALSGMKLWDTQILTSLSPGQYFAAYGVSTTQTTQGTAALSAARMAHSHIGMTLANNTLGQFGVANNASVMWISGIGSYSKAGGGTTGSLNFSNVSSSASHVVPFIQMLRFA